MALERQLLNFIVERELLNRIDDFRFQNRFATRAGAIKWLLNQALEQGPNPRAVGPAPAIASELPVVSLAPEPPRAVEPGPASDSSSGAYPLISPAPPPLPVFREVYPTPVELIVPRMTPTPRSEPSHESVVQALKAQGYEVGETAFQDGQVRIVVRSSDSSALVSVGQELYELAAGRLTLSQIAARRRGA